MESAPVICYHTVRSLLGPLPFMVQRASPILNVKAVISLLLSFALASVLAVADENSEQTDDAVGLGPSAVPAQLKAIEKARVKEHPGWPSLPSLEQHNLSLAADYQLLYQHLDDGPGEKNGVGGVARFYGTWKPNPGSTSPGRLVFKVEHRHRLGTNITPQQQLPEAGVAGLSGPTFSDSKAVLTNLFWGQSLINNRFGYVVGVVDVSDYVDVYGLVNPWTEFNNLAFSTNPVIPAPSQGLGAAARWLSRSNYYVVAGLADANADSHQPQDFLDNVFNTAEYFKHVEFGRIGSWENRMVDNAHITLWQVDKRQEAGIKEDWGIDLSWSQQRGKWQPFARAGYADRGVGLQKQSISIGAGYAVDHCGNFIGTGISWGESADSDRNQTIIESYYKWQALPHVLLVPGMQFIANPAYNEREDYLWLASVKGRVTF